MTLFAFLRVDGDGKTATLTCLAEFESRNKKDAVRYIVDHRAEEPFLTWTAPGLGYEGKHLIDHLSEMWIHSYEDIAEFCEFHLDGHRTWVMLTEANAVTAMASGRKAVPRYIVQ
jgi:hypothetical protein